MNKEEKVNLNGYIGIGLLLVISIGLGYYIGLSVF